MNESKEYQIAKMLCDHQAALRIYVEEWSSIDDEKMTVAILRVNLVKDGIKYGGEIPMLPDDRRSVGALLDRAIKIVASKSGVRIQNGKEEESPRLCAGDLGPAGRTQNSEVRR